MDLAKKHTGTGENRRAGEEGRFGVMTVVRLPRPGQQHGRYSQID